jgi:hypothetical protein
MFALVVALAVALVMSGLRGWRVGDEPFCSRCGYSLTGLESGACPECGTPITIGTTVHGVCKPSRLFIGLGTGTLLLIPITYVVFAGIDWVHESRKPYRQPFKTVRERSAAGDYEATLDLRRRVRAGQLSEEEADLVADQAFRNLMSGGWVWADILLTLEAHLSDVQKKQALAQLLILKLVAPSRVRKGDRLFVALDCRVQQAGLDDPELELHRVLIDGRPVAEGGAALPHPLACSPLPGLGQREPVDLGDLDPGLHTLEYEVHVDWLGGRYVTVTAEFEIVSADDPSPVHRSTAADVLRERGVILCYRDPTVSEGGLMLRIQLFGPTPTDLAFDVILKPGDHELNLGSAYWEQGPGVREATFKVDISNLQQDRAGLVLRPDRTVDVKIPDGYEAWSEDVRFEDIEFDQWRDPDDGTGFDHAQTRHRRRPFTKLRALPDTSGR